jgi:small subunit ribosomal protein S5
MRAVFEMLGVRDVVAKSMGTSNPYNMVRATFDALKGQENPRAVAARRGKKVSEIVSRRRDGAGEATEGASVTACASARRSGRPGTRSSHEVM